MIVPVLVAQRYPEQTWVLSIVESAFAVGLFVGSAVLVGLSDRLFGRRRTVLAGFAVLGAGFVGTGLLAMAVGFGDALVFTAASALLLALPGAGLCMITTNTGTVRLLATPSSHRNRMVATWVLTASTCRTSSSTTSICGSSQRLRRRAARNGDSQNLTE
ncbi:hypothetical protein [Streptomyces chartreusis]|uniref:hypothetical protein n=1 Tax=Streptomyces chartreusis TaxID=1969 RepID=UPI0036631AFD